MLGIKRIVIADHERGLLFRDRRLAQVLKPGVHTFFDPRDRMSVSVHDATQLRLDVPGISYIAKTQAERLDDELTLVETHDLEIAYVYGDGILAYIVGPGARAAFWTSVVPVAVQRQSIAEDATIPGDKVELVRALPAGRLPQPLNRCTVIVAVPDHYVGLLLVSQSVAAVLEPGLHAYWSFRREIAVELVDLRPQTLEVAGQEILSKDKVSLRINLSAEYHVTDAQRARSLLVKPGDVLYRQLQFGLRQAVGTRTLDQLLEDKATLDSEIAETVSRAVSGKGVALDRVGIKDVILPGEMRELLNQVVAAEKAAQANVIRRREETAATRSLLNTAKLMDDNPTLLRLKELELAERVAEKIESFTVMGGMDAILSSLGSIRVGSPSDAPAGRA